MTIGMLSFRFAGTDGVTLEAAKLADVLRRAGHEVVWFGGELGPEYRPGREYPPAHFLDTDNVALQERLFGVEECPPEVAAAVEERAVAAEHTVAEFVDTYGVDRLFIHNVLSLPLQVPLAVGLARYVAATGIGAVVHHHDFWWERTRFQPCAVPDILAACFPPTDVAVRHVVIHTGAAESLRDRLGIEATVLPNLMDFESEPAPGDGEAFRRYAGLGDDERLILQPTRVIPRKGIETTLELARRLGDRHKVVITHGSGDEGDTYPAGLRATAEELGVDLRFATAGEEGLSELADAYAAADLVTFPSRIEGFGNALLETFYFRRPVLVNRYEVYVRDIGPTGVECIEIEDGRLTGEVVEQARRWVEDPSLWEAAVERNYRAGLEHFSYAVARERLLPLFD